MINKGAPSVTPEGTNKWDGVDALVGMHCTMDELRRYNLTLEGDVHKTRQHQQDSNPLEDMELFDPEPLLAYARVHQSRWGPISPGLMKPPLRSSH